MIDPEKVKIADVPDGFERRIEAPSELAEMLATAERPCGEGRFTVLTDGGPLTEFCSEPLCLNTGSCTGPRFVPHLDQYTADGRSRRFTAKEAVLGSRAAAKLAAAKTGRDDERTDKEVAKHIGLTLKKMTEQLKGPGRWTR